VCFRDHGPLSTGNDTGHVTRAERFKTSLQFLNVPYNSMYLALDACKVADYVVFALSPVVEVDNWGDVLLRTLQAQGLPDVVTVVSPNDSLDSKARPAIIKSLLSFVQYFVPTQTRVFDLYTGSDRLNALRALSEGKPAEVRWREDRAWLVGEHVEWDDGVLRVTGFVRGAPLSANRLVHLPNYGDFQICKVSTMLYNRAVIRLISVLDNVCPGHPDVQVCGCGEHGGRTCSYSRARPLVGGLARIQK
jgi:pre-rRNA-processing protein TSR1